MTGVGSRALGKKLALERRGAGPTFPLEKVVLEFSQELSRMRDICGLLP